MKTALFLDSLSIHPMPKAHYETTGPEIYEDTDGQVDYSSLVQALGEQDRVGQYLKSKKPETKIIAVEPKSSPVLSEGHGGAHKIQGIGAGFVPEVLDTTIYDEIIPVTNEDAFALGKEIGRTEGILVAFQVLPYGLQQKLQNEKKPKERQSLSYSQILAIVIFLQHYMKIKRDPHGTFLLLKENHL